MKALAPLLCVVLVACTRARAPEASAPYSVRLLGAADGALRGAIRHGQPAFTGRAGRDYAIEVTNDTASEVGVSIILDGLDAMTGEPTESCARLGMWILRADGRTRVRGFSLSATRIATYRFAPPAQALAAIAKGGHPEAIGTIAVCFFSLKPAPPHEEEGSYGFRGTVESDAPAAIAGELRDEPPSPRGRAPDVVPDQLLSRIVITYEDEDGAPLGTAPPPAGIARVASPRREAAPPEPEPELEPHQPSKYPLPPKRQKRPIKGGKPDKG
jgi:hypothetical protein